MIPLRLTVQGLYSYKEPQVIDFETLAGSQLFGIFGAVGSGKSSILEAVVFALYDRSERLNKSGDNRYYNMLNLQSQQFAIDFIFQVTSPQPTKYRFTVSARRKKKDYESVEVKERRQYRWQDNDWLPIEGPDAASIVGMTYENFMQTVIIPQGKFREFIDQRPNDRTQMLKELFRLEKFDLSHKTNHLLATVRSTITDLEARVSEIGPVTAEAIDVTRQEMREVEISLQQNAELLREAEETCENYENLRKLFADRAVAEEQHQALRSEQTRYQAREARLQEYREAETYFNEKFKTLSHTVSEQRAAEAGLAHTLSRIQTGRHKLQEAQQQCERARQNYANRDTIRIQCRDWEHLRRICQGRSALQQLAQEEAASRTAYEQQQAQCTALKQRIKATEKRWLKAVSTQEQQTVLRAVTQWHAQKKAYASERAAQQQAVKEQQRHLVQLEERKQQTLNEIGWPIHESFDAIFNRLGTANESLRKETRTALEKLGDLRVRHKLARAAQRLVAGQACPLCGATHHPAVAHAPDISETIAQQEKKLAELQAQEEQYATLETSLRKLQNDYQSVGGKREGAEQLLQATEARLATHETQFLWEAYRDHDPEALLELLQAGDRQLAERKQLDQERNEQRTRLEQLEGSLTATQQDWQQKQQRWLAARSQADNHRSLLQVLAYEEHASLDETQILRALEKCQSQLQDVEEQYEAERQRCQEYEKALGILEGKKVAEQQLLNALSKRAAAIEEEIQALCQQKEFDSVDYVRSIIDSELDVKAEQDAIVSYKNRLHAAEETCRKLTDTIREKHYDPAGHQEAQHTCVRLKEAIEQLQHAWAVARREVKEQQQKLVKITQLNQLLAAQHVRANNLKELSGLFRGSGFVNYASTVLLEEVCRGANVRFKQLTKNNLSLELNKENEFIVRDYLNGGKTRLLKTLSGGQTFQAALCLALALAENIRSLNQSRQSFFFLDEGFGSLDKDSLRVVFDTLKSLRQENRIVGIISHVEELQQEIDVYLKIEHDRERGSLVKGSWE
jgi:exonuclease SbcC